MKKVLLTLICLVVVFSPCSAFSKARSIRFFDIQPELDSTIEKLSLNIDLLEDAVEKMDASARTNQNYNEQKNIFLSSQLTIETVAAILSYNRDLLVLFGDLKEKNRKKFYEVRIESLETSVVQIKNMYRQMQINLTILPADFFEQAIVNTKREVITSSIAFLNRCVDLLKSVNQKYR